MKHKTIFPSTACIFFKQNKNQEQPFRKKFAGLQIRKKQNLDLLHHNGDQKEFEEKQPQTNTILSISNKHRLILFAMNCKEFSLIVLILTFHQSSFILRFVMLYNQDLIFCLVRI